MAILDEKSVFTGELLAEDHELTLVELCRTCGVQAETVEALVEHGILEPTDGRGTQLRFRIGSIKRTRIAVHLQRDLDVNLPGAALALDLLEQIAELEARLRSAGEKGRER
jgi:chaperone modulatory protein CbpM